jgi:hypothetical protein
LAKSADNLLADLDGVCVLTLPVPKLAREIERAGLEAGLSVVPDPQPAELLPHSGSAHPKDSSILVAALREGCPWLVTFNVRHFQPGHPDVTVLRPGKFLSRVRDLLAHLSVG